MEPLAGHHVHSVLLLDVLGVQRAGGLRWYDQRHHVHTSAQSRGVALTLVTLPFLGILLNTFNLFFASLPILAFSLFDMDLIPEDLLRFPEVYTEGIKNTGFTKVPAAWQSVFFLSVFPFLFGCYWFIRGCCVFCFFFIFLFFLWGGLQPDTYSHCIVQRVYWSWVGTGMWHAVWVFWLPWFSLQHLGLWAQVSKGVWGFAPRGS